MNPNCKILTEQRKHNPNNQIRNYLRYLYNNVRTSINEYNPIRLADETIEQQKELLAEIMNYGHKHILYFKHLFDPTKWSRGHLKALMGLDERSFYRWLKSERTKLITFIEEKENEIMGEEK